MLEFKSKITILLASLLFISCSVSSVEDELGGDNNIKTSENNLNNSTSDIDRAVSRHNEIRAEVFNGSSVVWSDTVATTAQDYANYLASTGKWEHDNSGYGENLYAASETPSYVDAINSWYEEKSDYNYQDNSCNGVCGHYTQIVWKNTTEIGCGKAVYTTGNMRGYTVIVCRYNPPGNYIGEKPY
ncbi:Pathogenesis-related protein 1C precursor [hydrothermal vent metagenome]|uniref:Pathogenesis-related protein 1C n=1 Tax=hydrothermal vent metagenome TaxID=652676 RepID=A0A1W1EIX6_9ZZZZ